MSSSSFNELNIERLLAAFKREKLDRVPNFESIIDPKVTSEIMNCKE